MKTKPSAATADAPEKDKLWQKTSFANLIRYLPSGMYFCRIRVMGHLIRKSLKTDVLSVAKLRLTDEEKKHRQAAQHQLAIQRGRGQMTFMESLEIYRARLQANPDIKSKTKKYYEQRVDSLLKTWPGLENTNLRDLSKQACLDWAAKYGGSATAFNNTALVLRAVLDIAIESGVIYENVARHVARRPVRPKELHLPDNSKFAEFVQTIEKAGGRFSRDCADLVRFLSYGGFRLGEAKNVTWADCDFVREEIIVRGDPDEGTKNSEVRRVPMIGEMRQLLERRRNAHSDEPATDAVIRQRLDRHQTGLRQILDSHPNPSDFCPISVRFLSELCPKIDRPPSDAATISRQANNSHSFIRHPPPPPLVAVRTELLAFRGGLVGCWHGA